jgi:hypothetical protein
MGVQVLNQVCVCEELEQKQEQEREQTFIFIKNIHRLFDKTLLLKSKQLVIHMHILTKCALNYLNKFF